MKKVICALIFFILFGFSVNNSIACTCVTGDLSKRFKKAKAVFVGSVYEYEDEDIPKIQNYK